MERGSLLKILSLDTVDSTQKYLLRELKSNNIKAPIAVVAKNQTAGIGSRENSWKSYEGNLFFSFAVAKADLPNDLKIESASIYFAYILKMLLEVYGSAVWIKWPNDFYIKDKKIGGMITNVVGENIVCGIGLNLLSSPKQFETLDIKINSQLFLKEYFENIAKKLSWKQVFSKYKLEFDKNKNFFAHICGVKLPLREAKLSYDGSLEINGERIYSLR